MKINRNNYEEYFVLYASKELSAAEKTMVEEFVQENPDLAIELTMFTQSILKPDESVRFTGKDLLYREISETEEINHANYETYFLSYADGELSNVEQAMVEKFVYHHPELQSEFEVLQHARLTPDVDIVFPDKSLLYRSEKDEKAVPVIFQLTWFKVAVAAMIIIIAGYFWFAAENVLTPAKTVAQTKGTKNSSEEGNKRDAVTVTPEKRNGSNDVHVTGTEKVQPAGQQLNGSTTTDVALKHEKDNTHSATHEAINTPAETNHLPLIASVDKGNRPVQEISAPVAKTDPAIAANLDHAAPIIDKMVYVNTDKTAPNISYAVENDENKDKVFVSNTSLNKKNALRGLFRKASRFVQRTTRSGQDEEGSGLLIGNFALR